MINNDDYQVIEVSIECQKLVNMDFLSKTDTFVRVLTKNVETNKIDFVGRTEIIWDNLNPRFQKKIHLNQSFAELLRVVFEVYDADEDKMNGNEPKLVPENQVGKTEVAMSDIIRNMGNRMKSEITHHSQKNRGMIVVYAEQTAHSKDIIDFDLKFDNLNKKSGIIGALFSFMSAKFTPILSISKQIEDGTQITVQTSEEIRKEKLKFSIKKQQLNGCDDERNIRFKIFNRTSNGDLDTQQKLTTTFSILRDCASLTFEDSQCKMNLRKVSEKEVSNQLDYLNCGMQINLILSVDFTASNLDYRMPNSLHQLGHQNSLNQQEKCMSLIAPILIQWDSDKLVPIQGFGAKINGITNHCFPMFNGDGVFEVQGVMSTQRQWLSSNALTFSGPTNFAPTLRMLNQTAEGAGPADQFILLIMTDGQICDMEATISEIVASSYLPISIIIAGVGRADFGNMDILDSDDERLQCKRTKKTQVRDNVQFVPFEQQMKDFELLKKEVLMELPEQIEGYQAYKKIKPNQFRNVNISAGSIKIPSYY